MTRYTSSPACRWVQPRPRTNPSLRYMAHGPIQPMIEERPGFLARLFGRGR